jgi:hypothetical protein
MIGELDSVKKTVRLENSFLRGQSERTSGYHAAAHYELLSDENRTAYF